jgi:hypothetical protein
MKQHHPLNFLTHRVRFVYFVQGETEMGSMVASLVASSSIQGIQELTILSVLFSPTCLMPLQVLLLYPPTTLTPARVAQDLAEQQCPTRSLTWLKLQDEALDASGSSIRGASTSPTKAATHDDVQKQVDPSPEPLADQTEVGVTANPAFPIKPSTRSTTRNRESLRAWKSHNVTFDMTHEVATIPYYDSSAESQQQHQMLTRSTIKSSAQGHHGLISGFGVNVSLILSACLCSTH